MGVVASAPAAAIRLDESVPSEVGRIAPIEGMRGIAVLWVVVFHYVVLRQGRYDDPWISAAEGVRALDVLVHSGFLGVDLFFLITGFLLTLPWFVHRARGLPAPSALAFYRRRFWRIAPAYYVQLVVLFALVLPLLRGLAYWRSDLYVVVANVLAHLAFLQNTTPLTSASLNINGALWTLSLEAQYYVLVPLLAPLFLRAPLACLAGSCAIALAWQYGAGNGLDTLVAFQQELGKPWGWPERVVRHVLLTQLPSYLAHFALGIVAGRLWLQWRARPPSSAMKRALGLATVAALGFLYWIFAYGGAIFGEATWIVTPLAFAIALFAAAAGTGPIAGRVLARGPLAFLGKVSYSAYLYHLPLLIVWNAFAAGVPGWASFPLFFGAVIAVAWTSWRFVEQRYLRGP